MPRTANPPPVSRAYVRLDSGLRLVSLDFLLSQLAPMGLTKSGFRRLLDNLSVPTIEVGRTRLVDLFSFQIALRSVLRIGEPDFLAPGCSSMRRMDKRTRPTRPFTTKLDLDRFRANWKVIVSEMVASRRAAGRLKVYKLVPLAEKAAERLLAASVHLRPLEEQAASDKAALQSAKALEVFHDAP